MRRVACDIIGCRDQADTRMFDEEGKSLYLCNAHFKMCNYDWEEIKY